MMKRRHDNNSEGQYSASGKVTKSNKGRQASGYFADPKLIPRVRQYLSVNKKKRVVTISTIVDDLQKQYGEYQRKKRSSFFKSVEKAYQLVCEDVSEEEASSDDDIVKLEASHMRKKKKSENSGFDTDDSEVKSFSSENPDYVAYEDRNAVNRFLTDMYKSSPKQSCEALYVVDKEPGRGKDFSVEPQMMPGFGSSVLGMEKDLANPATRLVCDSEDSSPLKEETLSPATTAVKADLDTSRLSEATSVPQKIRRDVHSTRKRKMKKSAEKSEKETADNKGIQAQTSSVTFADVGGNEACLKEICKLLVHMRHPEVYQTLGVIPPRGFLLHGPPGCGKTLLANAVAGELNLPFIKLSAPEVVSGVSGESEEKLRDLFDKAVACAPCIVFIDEIDAITPKRETASKDMERRIVAQLLTCLDDLNSRPNCHVLVIGATNRPDSLDPALRRAGRFDREISLGIPDESARARIMGVLCRGLKLSEDFDFAMLARETPGYVGADLMALAREAAMTAVNRVFKDLESRQVFNTELVPKTGDVKTVMDTIPTTDSSLDSLLSWLKEEAPLTEAQLRDLSISMEDFKSALQFVQPSAKREGFATIPDVTWEDIGALQSVRQELKLAILAPIRHREDFKALGLSNPPGILLAGPPGCGKTLLAKAIANESGINFISVKGPELLNMYVGESERAVRQVFQRARNSAPCVIFFDELDALCPRRSDSRESGSSVRVVNQLLTEMDGLEERKQVFIMAATNRPDIIDPAILRPGRLDKTLYVGLPTLLERLDIFNTITKNGTKPKLSEDVNLSYIADHCEGFTGADLAAVVREASMAALKEKIDSPDSNTGPIHVFHRHFNMALLKVKPSVSQKDHKVYESIKNRLES